MRGETELNKRPVVGTGGTFSPVPAFVSLFGGSWPWRATLRQDSLHCDAASCKRRCSGNLMTEAGKLDSEQ